MTDVTGRDIQRFKMFRSKEIGNVTLKSQMDTLRVFLRFCESIDACIPDLSESVNSPSLSDGEGRGTDIIRADRAEEILAYLSKYKWASIYHVVVRTLWESGMRMGAARATDKGEVDLRNQYINL